jgi:methionyl-tRNA synthetase
MTETAKRYYITTPIYYVNGEPHCGTATTTLLADATKRYHRLRGENPYMLTGTDENARKVTEAAAMAGRDPQEFVDAVSQRFVEAWKLLNIDYDVFFRTTEPRHARVVQEVFERLKATGDIYLGTYEGWYSVTDETFFRDTDVDADTQTAKETGAKVERVQEETYFFRLSAYGERLAAYILANPDFLLPDTRRNEVLAFIDQGLRDIAITQNRSGWGILVPGETDRVIYVWFDALINYLTESGWPEDGWESLWPADVHLVGKEIYTRFHATLWPAMLMALDLPLPGHVVGHGWWLVRDPETDKLVKGSKSGVPLPMPAEMVAYLEERSGASQAVCVDALRYYLVRDIAFSSDAEFSIEMLVKRYNGDLANDLGNVLNRVLRAKYHTGTIPHPQAHDDGLRALAASTVIAYENALKRFDWGTALQATWNLLGEVNRYLAEKAPWTAARNGDTVAVADALYNALEATRIAAVLASPVLPSVCAEVAQQLGLAELAAQGSWETVTQFGGLVPGTPTGDAQPLFPRIEKKIEAAPVAPPTPKKEKVKPVSTEPTPPPAPVATPTETPSDLITIDDFARVQLRVADILECEPVPGAKKLLRLQVRVGADEERQIVSGIADAYKPEELVGRQIVVVYNLKPAVLRGVESQGMLLAATDAEGRAILLQPDKKAEAGSKVR